MKKLYRSKTNRIIGGVCGGVGEYFTIDPVIIRIIFIFLLLVTHIVPFILVYILGILVIPERPDDVIIVEEKKI